MIGKTIAALSAGLGCGLIVLAPVNKIAPRVLPAESGIAFYELTGSVLSGRAGEVHARGVAAKDLQWQLKPSRLLLGRLAADVRVSASSKNLSEDNAWLEARVSKPLFGDTVKVRDVHAAVPLSALQGPLKIPFLPVDGQLLANLDEIQLSGNMPTHIIGTIQLNNAIWKLGKPAAIGDFEATLSTENGNIFANIAESDSAAISLIAAAQIKPDRSYSTDAQIKPKASTPTALANQIKTLGRTDKQGWYSLKQSGTLPLP